MNKEVVFKRKTSKGKDFVIRYSQEGDAVQMCDYINVLSEERTFIRFQGERVTLKEEEEFLNKQLKRIEEQKAVMLVLIAEGRIVGIAGLDMKDKTESHQGILGISIAKEYRGEGLGKTLLRLVLEEGKKNIPQLRIVVMDIFANNHLARGMYEGFGFVEFGKLPKGILQGENYIDQVWMYKVID